MNADRGSLDAVLSSARAKVGAPGAQATVVACGKVVWAGASGVTDLNSKRPVNPGTPFVIASTTKTVTATMIMKEEQAGRLPLDTPLSNYYPKLPNAKKITLKLLLSNRSGLADYDVTQGDEHHWKRQDILKHVHANEPPGRFEYVNTNWVILGGILEKVSKDSVETYFRSEIAEPAGMTSTSTFERNQGIMSEMAHPYEREADGKLTTSWIKGFGLPTYYWGPVFTDGGLVSTATDLARFGNALMRAKLVNGATLALMTNVGKDNYGLGIFSKRFDGHYWLGHNGSYGGYESENWTDTNRQLTVTVTTNMGFVADIEPGVAERIWNAVAKAYDAEYGHSSPTRCT